MRIGNKNEARITSYITLHHGDNTQKKFHLMSPSNVSIISVFESGSSLGIVSQQVQLCNVVPQRITQTWKFL